jgi:two-component system, NtrC family, response regulator AtoC
MSQPHPRTPIPPTLVWTRDQTVNINSQEWKILIVDDDAASRVAMAEWLELKGYATVGAGTVEEAVSHLHDGIAVIVTDLKMPHSDGLELLRLAKDRAPHATVILVSGFGTVDTAVTALKEGAFDFLTKPVNLRELTHRIERALEKRAMAAEIASLHAQLRQRHGIHCMVGRSPAMRQLFEKIRLVADTRSTVLITGESGTGKELVARSLHLESSRRDQPFVPINCAAIPEALVESELFGHEKGAFTGATERREGLFQAAKGGTLFIDEIGELPLGLQSKLLRAIESRMILPVGRTREVPTDVRLVAATNRGLKELVDRREFRDDLYFRLKVVELTLPPLRERREDIPLLVRHFIEQIAEENQRAVREISPEALQAILAYDWPGNVRELRNTLEGAIVLSMNERIELADLPESIRGARQFQDLLQPGMTLKDLEREAIRRALQQSGGHRTQAAQSLGISTRTLQRKLKEYQLDATS